MNLFEMKKACLAKIENAYVIAEAEYGVDIPRVPVVFSNKQTRTAGTASYNRFMGEFTATGIKLSIPLLKLNGEEFINTTPGHEAAHIIDYTVFNNASHGTTWKRIMRLIGQPANRTHSMAVPHNNGVKVYCGCANGHIITKNRAGKMRKQTGIYICRKCNQHLTLIPTNTLDTVKPQERVAANAAPKRKSIHMTIDKRVPKSELVREVIRANPHMTIDELIVSIRGSDIGVKHNLVPSYVKNNVKKIRG